MTRVLVVEDEESYRDALVYMLTREGFDVVEAARRGRRAWPRTTGAAPTSCCST